VVRVPDAETEDVRQLSRGIDRLKCERNRHIARLKSLLVKEGLTCTRIGGSRWAEHVEGLRHWDGSALGANLVRELQLEGDRLALVERQLADLKAERERLVAKSESRIAQHARALRRLGAVAQESSFVFATELFGWRTFANRRELAGSVGASREMVQRLLRELRDKEAVVTGRRTLLIRRPDVLRRIAAAGPDSGIPSPQGPHEE